MNSSSHRPVYLRAAVVAGILLVVLGLVWSFRSPAQPREQVTPSGAENAASSGTLPFESKKAGENDTLASRQSDLDWLTQHAAKATIEQPSTGGGTIRVGSKTGTFADTPPAFHQILETTKSFILIGNSYGRNRLLCHLDLAFERTNDLQIQPRVVVDYPLSARSGGFVFHREESTISEIGVIIPKVAVPPGEDPDGEQYGVTVRFGSLHTSLFGSHFANVPEIPIDEKMIVLGNPSPKIPMRSARVFWLKVGEDGDLIWPKDWRPAKIQELPIAGLEDDDHKR
jgi:hypothetical protein